ncbi:hypothetical protein EDB95_1930 [Dinghuibacter silviterrae]|uniref:Lipoprotein n=1 Tax=Dinghuibacter silviterrae TaxID=1539049 RepID=A0A4R8DUQ9_9BACT|nr:hypothetical protein EDB95_1930 [Dinghuibacter silviterrae]
MWRAAAFAFVAALACTNGCRPSAGNSEPKHLEYGDSIPLSQLLKPYDSANAWMCYYNGFRARHPEVRDSIFDFCTIRTRDVLLSMGLDSATVALVGDKIKFGKDTVARFMRISVGYDTVTSKLRVFFQPVKHVKFDSSGNITDPGTAYYFDSTGKIFHRAIPFNCGAGKRRNNDTTAFVADLNTPCPPACNQSHEQ